MKRGTQTALILGGLYFATYAFTSNKRESIRKRAVNASELSRRTDRPLECSHLNHKRGRGYQDVENGILVTDIEHLAYHLYHIHQPEIIGLTEVQNGWAMDRIRDRVTGFNYIKGIERDIEEEVGIALTRWEEYYNPAPKQEYSIDELNEQLFAK